MKEILRHIVWMTILVSWALLSASCRGGEVSYTDEVQPDDDTAILVLRTGLLDQTRASDRVNDAVDNPVEYMYTLRIVILHETVLWNTICILISVRFPKRSVTGFSK